TSAVTDWQVSIGDTSGPLYPTCRTPTCVSDVRNTGVDLYATAVTGGFPARMLMGLAVWELGCYFVITNSESEDMVTTPESSKGDLPAEVTRMLDTTPQPQFVEVCAIDITGLMRGKRLPLASLPRLYEKGLCLPASTVVLDIHG